MHDTPNLKIGVAVLGTIGRTLTKAIDNGVPGLQLQAVAARDHVKAQHWLAQLRSPAPILSFAAMAEACDVVVECAPAALLGEIVTPVLHARKTVVVLSCGGLLLQPQLIDLARQSGGCIHVPTGALLGLDAMIAAAQGKIYSVRMVTRKPPASLLGAPYLSAKHIDLTAVDEPVQVFSGSAREAASGFPANLNVAAGLALAGIGPDATQVEIWADPTATRNIHTISVESDAARFEMSIENIPSENPKTGRITAQSVLALLHKMRAPLRIGT